jgi:hypothetical protein
LNAYCMQRYWDRINHISVPVQAIIWILNDRCCDMMYVQKYGARGGCSVD